MSAPSWPLAAEAQDDAAAFLGPNITNSVAGGRNIPGFASELKAHFDGGTWASGAARVSFKF